MSVNNNLNQVVCESFEFIHK